MMGAASDEEVPDLIELIRRAPNSDGGGGGYSSDRTTQFVLSALAGNRLSGLVMSISQLGVEDKANMSRKVATVSPRAPHPAPHGLTAWV